MAPAEITLTATPLINTDGDPWPKIDVRMPNTNDVKRRARDDLGHGYVVYAHEAVIFNYIRTDNVTDRIITSLRSGEVSLLMKLKLIARSARFERFVEINADTLHSTIHVPCGVIQGTQKQIAEEIGLAERTFKTNIQALFKCELIIAHGRYSYIQLNPANFRCDTNIHIRVACCIALRQNPVKRFNRNMMEIDTLLRNCVFSLQNEVEAVNRVNNALRHDFERLERKNERLEHENERLENELSTLKTQTERQVLTKELESTEAIREQRELQHHG